MRTLSKIQRRYCRSKPSSSFVDQHTVIGNCQPYTRPAACDSLKIQHGARLRVIRARQCPQEGLIIGSAKSTVISSDLAGVVDCECQRVAKRKRRKTLSRDLNEGTLSHFSSSTSRGVSQDAPKARKQTASEVGFDGISSRGAICRTYT